MDVSPERKGWRSKVGACYSFSPPLSSEYPLIKGWPRKAQCSSGAWPGWWLWIETPTKQYHFQKALSALGGYVTPILKQEWQQFLFPCLLRHKVTHVFQDGATATLSTHPDCFGGAIPFSPFRNSDWRVGFLQALTGGDVCREGCSWPQLACSQSHMAPSRLPRLAQKLGQNPERSLG